MNFRGKALLLSFDTLTGVYSGQVLTEDRMAYAEMHESIPKGKVCTVQVGRWYKSKSTGPESQNNKAFGLARQIAKHIGEDVEELVRGACLRAEKRGYPVDRDPFGVAIPKRWSQANSAEASMVIEQLYEDAAFLGIILVEPST